jgi:ABC-type Mn2+/Zn2+ transport system ATPase subunit
VIITGCILQGFKGIAESFTLQLKPGVNLVTGGNESGKSTLCEGILSALFAPPSSSAFLNWSHPETCRILLFFSTPRGRFRIAKDFVRHSVDLSTWDPAKSAFVSMTQDLTQATSLLAKELGGVDEAVYRTLFLLQPPRRSSIRPAPEVASAVQPSSAPTEPGVPPEKRKDRLQELKGFLETHKKIREAELLLDSLRLQSDETRATLQGLTTQEEERQTIREALERFEPLASLTTASLLPQIAEYQKAIEKREGDARDIAQKIDEEQARMALIPSTPIYQHRLFLIGGGVLLASLVAAQFLPYVSAGVLIGLGCIAGALVQFLTWSQNRDKIRKVLLGLEFQLKKGLDLRVSRQFQSLMDLLPRTGCQEVSELATKLRQRDALMEKLAALDKKIAGLSAEADSAALAERRKSLEEAIQLAEEELRSLGFVPEPSEVQREIEELERGTASPQGSLLSSKEGPPQPADTLLPALERLLGGLSPSLVSAIETQASRLISHMTAGRYTHIHRTSEDGLRLGLAGNQEERPLVELSDGTQDQAMLAWHLALLTAIPQASSVPLLLDDPFVRVDGERRKRLIPFLQSLARTHQVVLFSHEAWIPTDVANVVPLARANNRTPSSGVA